MVRILSKKGKKMKTIKLEVYSYSELSKANKEKIKDDIIQILAEVYDSDFIIDIFREKLLSFGFDNIDFSFNISYSQGDGLSFEGNISESDAANLVGLNSDDYDGDSLIVIERINSRYSHSNSVSSYSESGNKDLEDKFENWRVSKCNEFFDELVKDYEFATGEEAFNNYIEANSPEYVIINNNIIEIPILSPTSKNI
jgi:hypothetical protein